MFNITAYHPSKGLIQKTIPKGMLDNIEPGCRYFVCLENGLDLALILLEIFKRDAIAVPVVPGLTESQKQHIIEHADVDGIFVREHDVIQFHHRKSELKSPEDHRFIIYTSGSTGMPKGVVQTLQSVTHNAKAVAKLHDFSAARAHATCLPLFHCNALMMSLIGCYLTNCPLVILSSFNASAYFKIINKHQVKTASIVPALLTQIVDEKPDWPSSLEYLITAAAPLSKELAKDFFKLYGSTIRQGYGLSEAVNFSFVTPLLEKEEFVQEYLWNSPPVGLALEGTEFKLASDGEVLVRGPNNMLGYWKNPEISKATLDQDNWLKTGDIGEIRNNFLVLQGRKKEIINRGGESFHPAELEESYREKLSNDFSFAVVPTAHRNLDNEIGVVLDTADQNVTSRSILELLKQFIESNRIPAVLAFKKLSRTSTGKPQRIKDGKSLFVNQASNQDILILLWSLKYFSTFSSSELKTIDRVISKIIPNHYTARLAESINEVSKSELAHYARVLAEHFIAKLMTDYLKQAGSSYVIDNAYALAEEHRFKTELGDIICWQTGLNCDGKSEKLTSLKANEKHVTICILEQLDNGLDNPIRMLFNKFEKSILPCQSIEFLNQVDLTKYNVALSPIKFKQSIFAYIVELSHYE